MRKAQIKEYRQEAAKLTDDAFIALLRKPPRSTAGPAKASDVRRCTCIAIQVGEFAPAAPSRRNRRQQTPSRPLPVDMPVV